jgi:hypothetical protein
MGASIHTTVANFTQGHQTIKRLQRMHIIGLVRTNAFLNHSVTKRSAFN